MDDTFPDDELLARCNDPTLWQRVKLLADLSNLENAVREVVHLLRQIAHQTPEQHHGAELRIVRAKWDVDEYLGAVGDQARVSRRHIDPVLILAIRTADRLAVGVPIEPPSDDRLDDLLAGVAQDIRDATEALPFRLEETEPHQDGTSDCVLRETHERQGVVRNRKKKSSWTLTKAIPEVRKLEQRHGGLTVRKIAKLTGMSAGLANNARTAIRQRAAERATGRSVEDPVDPRPGMAQQDLELLRSKREAIRVRRDRPKMILRDMATLLDEYDAIAAKYPDDAQVALERDEITEQITAMKAQRTERIEQENRRKKARR